MGDPMGGIVERLWQLFEPYLAAEGVELDDIRLGGPGSGKLLAVTVDAEGGLGSDRIARIATGLSRLLDEEDPIPGSYRLEVTSPGLERKLRRPAHYRKSVGREVKVKTFAPVDGDKVHRGVLGEVDDDGFVLQLSDGVRRIGFGEVAAAQTIFVWEPAPKPGQRRG